ncbi:MAG: DUF4445 domain-containing protein [Synergistaceae bacterium]|nr:DUF4445 domain-containing protein [Synergistaceae bacterium]MBR0222145.1 DUF4445 domain-containing protein [Synergistaceae bacterium]
MVLAANNLIDAPCGGRGVCGKCGVEVDGVKKLSCEVRVIKDIEVTLPESEKASKITSTGFKKNFELDKAQGLGIAVDIGTTTVVAVLVDLASGKELESYSCLNSQKICGQDVITRIHYSDENLDGLKYLQNLILDDLRNLINKLLENYDAQDVKAVTVAGNTTMIHLFAGVNPHSLSAAPYKPMFDGALKLSAKDLNLNNLDCEVYCLPAVAAYVGGDITAGVLACGIDEMTGKILFIDIGTNGEMILANNSPSGVEDVKSLNLFACSCAAGPALEGMNITCGLRASDGAIDDVSIINNKIKFSTINNATPRGICGSGLLALIAELRSHKIINSSGRFNNHELVSLDSENKKRVVLDAEHDIYLSQKDIRQVQLAKGAILSGVVTMLKAADLKPEELDKVIIAGQFGAHLKAESITGAGLIPDSLTQKIIYAGNTSISGAEICLLSQTQRGQCENFTSKINYIELSTLEGFDKIFIESLKF